MSIAPLLHLFGVVVWVGGMFFAYMALRPVAAAVLEPPQRLSLWAGVFAKFFPWVWLSVVLILGSGLTMLIQLGGASAPLYALAMLVLGSVMMLRLMPISIRIWPNAAAPAGHACSATARFSFL